jgi:hypothetical protein
MLELNFNTLYGYLENNCWICKNILISNLPSYYSGSGSPIIRCDNCKYHLYFLQYTKTPAYFIALKYNEITVSRFDNKLNIQFPINLDKCIETICKLQILL